MTTDAGLGKTVNLQELAFEINGGPVPGDNLRSAGGHSLAFLIRLVNMPDVTNQDFERCVLLPQFRLTPITGVERLDDDTALRLLRRLRDHGQIVLLFDELDQVSGPDGAIDALEALLKNPRWDKCPIVLAGRPFAMNRFRQTLFDPFLHQWRFVSLDEFSVPEQRIMLGRTADGSQDRYGLIHEEAREILGVPRVLEYLRDVDDALLRAIRTPSDVYWFAIRKLLARDMAGSKLGRGIGRLTHESPDRVSVSSLDRAMKLLGALAFEMTCQPRRDEQGHTVPNFARVPLKPGKQADFRRFKEQVCCRLDGRLDANRTEDDRRYFNTDLEGLAALNSFLGNAFLDVEPTGLTQILWRNRTLQEFFAAWWLANFCTEKDAQGLADWIYLPYQPLTEEYYWIWRFLTEMPDLACDDPCWVRAVEPLFRPGHGEPVTTKRSCEMIYRAWPRLKALQDDAEKPNDDARNVLAVFQGEFEQILTGQEDDRQRVAQDFVDHFQDVHAGTFRMGTPDDKQGWTLDYREAWRRQLATWQHDPEGNAKARYADLPPLPGKTGKALRERQEASLASIIRSQNLRRLEDWWAPHDENPAKDSTNPHIDAFQLSRYPTLNAWYRLFDPEHGTRPAFYLPVYQRVSGTDEQPAIFVSWYDAWVFCHWAYWNGQECRLPHEDEWEYVAKAGTPWERTRWWGDDEEPLAVWSTYEQDYTTGSTTAPGEFDPTDAGTKDPPTRNHRNPWGFVDMLGNVWEWTEDLYRRQYTREDGPPEFSARVCRGGSWVNRRERVRSGVRHLAQPTNVSFVVGFRVARALPRKP